MSASTNDSAGKRTAQYMMFLVVLIAEFKCHFHASGTARTLLDAVVLAYMDFVRNRVPPKMGDGR